MKLSSLKKVLLVLAVCVYSSAFLCSCNGKVTDPGTVTSETEVNEYEHLKTDIVGMWMDEGGPLWGSNAFFYDGYRFYEFTSDGKMIYHHLYKSDDEGINDGTLLAANYHIEGNTIYLDPPSTEEEQAAFLPEGAELVETSDSKTGDEDIQESEEVSDTDSSDSETADADNTESSESESTTNPNEENKAQMQLEIQGNTMIMTVDSQEVRYTKLSLEETTAYLLNYTDNDLHAKQKEYSEKLLEEKNKKEREEKEAAEKAANESGAEESAMSDETDPASADGGQEGQAESEETAAE